MNEFVDTWLGYVLDGMPAAVVAASLIALLITGVVHGNWLIHAFIGVCLIILIIATAAALIGWIKDT